MSIKYTHNGKVIATKKSKLSRAYEIDFFAKKNDIVYLVLTNKKNGNHILKKVGIETDTYIRFSKSHPMYRIIRKATRCFTKDGVYLQTLSFKDREYLYLLLENSPFRYDYDPYYLVEYNDEEMDSDWLVFESLTYDNYYFYD